MIDDDHATREQNLAADAASLRAALEQEKHISACALETCERLRKERDEARASKDSAWKGHENWHRAVEAQRDRANRAEEKIKRQKEAINALTRERDDARIENIGLREKVALLRKPWEESENTALHAEVERLRTAMLDVARCDGHGDLEDCLDCMWLDNELCAVTGRAVPEDDNADAD